MLQSSVRFGIEKDVRVCDSCYSQLQAGRTPTGAAAAAAAAAAGSAAKRVTWADDQNWQDEQAAVLAKYAQHAKQKEKRNSEASQRAQEEVSVVSVVSSGPLSFAIWPSVSGRINASGQNTQ